MLCNSRVTSDWAPSEQTSRWPFRLIRRGLGRATALARNRSPPQGQDDRSRVPSGSAVTVVLGSEAWTQVDEQCNAKLRIPASNCPAESLQPTGCDSMEPGAELSCRWTRALPEGQWHPTLVLNFIRGEKKGNSKRQRVQRPQPGNVSTSKLFKTEICPDNANPKTLPV